TCEAVLVGHPVRIREVNAEVAYLECLRTGTECPFGAERNPIRGDRADRDGRRPDVRGAVFRIEVKHAGASDEQEIAVSVSRGGGLAAECHGDAREIPL